MTTLIIAKNILSKKVRVTYPDGNNTHEITVSEVIEKFKDENELWLDHFLNTLINTGESHSSFGYYELITK